MKIDTAFAITRADSGIDQSLRLVGLFANYRCPNPRESGYALDDWWALDAETGMPVAHAELTPDQCDKAQDALYAEMNNV